MWALTPDNQLWVNRCFVNGTFTWLEKLSPYHFLNGIENCWKAVESADFESPITFGAWRRSNFESRIGHIPTFCIYRLICLLSFCRFFVFLYVSLSIYPWLFVCLWICPSCLLYSLFQDLENGFWVSARMSAEDNWTTACVELNRDELSYANIFTKANRSGFLFPYHDHSFWWVSLLV